MLLLVRGIGAKLVSNWEQNWITKISKFYVEKVNVNAYFTDQNIMQRDWVLKVLICKNETPMDRAQRVDVGAFV